MEGRIKNLISFLVVLPEDPQNDYLHVFNGLYTGVMKYMKWTNNHGIYYRTRLLCDFYTYICIQLQEKLPYHVDNVKSNDALYPEPDFKEACWEKLQEVVKEIKDNLEEINNKEANDFEVSGVRLIN